MIPILQSKKVVANLVKIKYNCHRWFSRSNVWNVIEHDELEQMVNLVAIDSKFDFGKKMNVSAVLIHKIIIDEPNNLFNYCNVGYQTYYNSQEEIDLIENYFSMHIA
jgi:hypothetical protein